MLALSESIAADKHACGQLLAQAEEEELANASAFKAKLPQQLHASKFTGVVSDHVTAQCALPRSFPHSLALPCSLRCSHLYAGGTI